MTRRLHIVNRAGVFYWRRRLSGGLARAFGRSQIRISLRTREPSIARRIGQILSVQFDHFLYQMHLEQRVPTADEQRQILDQLHRLILDECKDEHLPSRPLDEIPPDQLIPITLTFRRFLDLAIQFATHAFDEAHAEASSAAGEIDFDQLMAKVAPSGARLSSHPASAQPVAALNAWSSTPVQTNASNGSLPISSFVPRSLADEQEHVTGGTAGQKAASLKLLLRIVGDIPADTITRKHVKYLHDTLQRIPVVYGKSPEDGEKPISTVIAGAWIGKGTMTVSTLDRHWRNINDFYRYVNRQDEVTCLDLERIFGDFRWSPKVPEGEERRAWSDESMAKLFESPIWTGFKLSAGKRHWRHERGDLVIKDEYWWLPLLGLYHGARLEEFCQLRGTDVVTEARSGIPVLNFHEGMKLKTKAAIRQVPVHSAIVRLGFLEFAAKAGPELLFPRLRLGGRDNKLSFEYTQDFSQYRKKVGVYEKLMDFHSFRHNVTTKMRDEGGRDFLEIDQITGHDSRERRTDEAAGQNNRDSASIGYFRGHRLIRLKEAIETVIYPAIDVDALMAAVAHAEMQEADLARRYPKT